MSVRSRGRYVPRPAPLTARKLRSPQDLNRRRPLARPIPTGPPRRSMFASTTRPVRHSTPLPLLRGHMRPASYVPGELIPLPLSGSIPELPHVAKVENRTTLKISRKLIFGLLCCCVAFQRHYGGP